MLTHTVKKNASTIENISFASGQTARVFDMEALGIDVLEFGNKTRSAFDCLPWDEYELRGRQLATLRSHWLGPFDCYQEEFTHFLEGNRTLSDLALFETLDSNKQTALHLMQYRRKRAVATFFLNQKHHHHSIDKFWHIERRATEMFVQTNSAFYPCQRYFVEIESEVAQAPEFQKILRFIPTLLLEKGVEAKKLKVVCHQVSLIATLNMPGHGSPEGIHQDGADFIVSALVVHRENISGGVSRLYHKSAAGDYQLNYIHLLTPGQGLFHADQDTNIWHEVTPITLADGASTGVRNSFGFDISVLE